MNSALLYSGRHFLKALRLSTSFFTKFTSTWIGVYDMVFLLLAINEFKSLSQMNVGYSVEKLIAFFLK